MDNTVEIIKKMIDTQKRLIEEKDFMDNLLTDIFEDAIINVSHNMGDAFMNHQKKTQQEVYTVISLKDNPNLNLSVAQPSKYKVEKTSFGTGIVCYRKSALNELKRKLGIDEKIIKITLDINEDTVLDLCGTRDKNYLKQVYNTISDKQQIETDSKFIDYVCKKGNKKVDIVAFFVILGSPLFEGSLITDYMDKGYLIKNANIISKAESV